MLRRWFRFSRPRPKNSHLDVIRVTKKGRKPLAKLLRGEVEATEATQHFDVARVTRVELEWDGSPAHNDSDIQVAGRHGLGRIKRSSGAPAGPVHLSLQPLALRVLVPGNAVRR